MGPLHQAHHPTGIQSPQLDASPWIGTHVADGSLV